MRIMDLIKYSTAGILFILAFSSIYRTDIINAIFFPSLCRRITIPVVFWIIVSLYAMLVHLLFYGKIGKQGPKTVRQAVIFGFLVNIYAMLANLVISLIRDSSFLSVYYFIYIAAIFIVFTSLISISAVLLFNDLKAKRDNELLYSLVFNLPLFILPVYFLLDQTFFSDRLFFAVVSSAYLIPYLLIKSDLLQTVLRNFKSILDFFKKDRTFIISIFILAFILRCFFAVSVICKTETATAKKFVLASDDGSTYDALAVKLAKGDLSEKVTVWGGNWDEGYSVFLAAIYKIFGRNFYVVTLIQGFMGAFLPVLIFLIGRLLFSRGTGIVASIAMVIKSPIIFLSIVLGHEAVWIPLSVFFIFMMTLYYKSDLYKISEAALAGIILALMCIFRGIFLYFTPFMFLWIIFLWRKKPIIERIKTVFIMGCMIFVIVYAVSIIFNNQLMSGSKDRLCNLWENDHLYNSLRIGNSRLTDIGVNFFRDLPGSMKAIANHPVKFFGVAAKYYPLRVVGYLQAYQFGFFDPIYLVNYAKCPNNFMPTLEFYFTLFFLYGLFLCFKKPFILKSPVFMMLSFNIIIYAIIFCNMAPRYKDASTPFVYLIGSYGFITILDKLNILKKGSGTK